MSYSLRFMIRPVALSLALSFYQPGFASTPISLSCEHGFSALGHVNSLASNKTQEFPNLFLSPAVRKLEGAVSATQRAQFRAALAESRKEVEKAISTIFDRLVLPVNMPGEAAPVPVHIFEVAQKIAKEIDPTARIAPSGGVVRSVLGALYEEMLIAAEKNPTFNAKDFLSKVAQGKHTLFDAKGRVKGYDILGVGSDFDLLLEADETKFAVIASKIKNLFQVSDSTLTKKSDPNDMNKAFFTVIDIKPLNKQIDRTVLQGGATTDLLFFDLEKKLLVEPKNVNGIIDELLLGRYRYLPANDGHVREAPQVTAMRGPRSLVEMPFLQLDAESELRLSRELKAILDDIVERNRFPEEKAIAQINKLRRNGRLGMGNNSIRRADPESPLGLIDRIAKALAAKQKAGLLKFPTDIDMDSYVSRYALTPERRKLVENLPENLRKYLVSREDYLRTHTDNGYVYHGTTGQGALGILRGGFRQTEYQTGALTGSYVTKNMMDALHYTKASGKGVHSEGEFGYVLKLKVKDDPFVTLDVFSISEKDRTAFQTIEAEARENGYHVGNWLAKKYGIDNLVLSDRADVSIINNAATLERTNIGQMARDTVEYINRELGNPEADFLTIMLERKRLEQAKPFFQALGIEIGKVPSTEEIEKLAVAVLPKIKDLNMIMALRRELIFSKELKKLEELNPSEAYGGRTQLDLLTESLAQDDWLAKEYAAGRGFGLPWSFKTLMKPTDINRRIAAAVKVLISRAGDTTASPAKQFELLHSLIFTVMKSSSEEVYAAAKQMPESVYESIRKAVAEQPALYHNVDFLEKQMLQRAGIKIDISSETIRAHNYRIVKAKNNVEKLEEVLSLSGQVNFEFSADNLGLRKLVDDLIPQLKEDEDLLSVGAAHLLVHIASHHRKPNAQGLAFMERVMEAVKRQAPNRAVLEEKPGANQQLSYIRNFISNRTQELQDFPDFLEKWKRIEELYK